VKLGVGLGRTNLPDFTRVNRGGNVQALARVLFGPYFFAFEATSVLLIVAAIGAMLHGRRRISREPTIDFPVAADRPPPEEPA
jgi:NADH:ubiquinone oxidoreductase subunit 6 (subunit J)